MNNKRFYYIRADHNTALAGDDIRNPDRYPPWLIADHTIESIIPTEWPLTLWEVEIIDPIENKSLPPGQRIGSDANYTRQLLSDY